MNSLSFIPSSLYYSRLQVFFVIKGLTYNISLVFHFVDLMLFEVFYSLPNTLLTRANLNMAISSWWIFFSEGKFVYISSHLPFLSFVQQENCRGFTHSHEPYNVALYCWLKAYFALDEKSSGSSILWYHA